MEPFRTLLISVLLTLGTLGLAGCASLRGLLTDEGKLYTQALALSDQGRPLGASALAAQALALDPGYQEARALWSSTFDAGQKEYREGLSRWSGVEDPRRWDELYQLNCWEDTLAALGPRMAPPLTVPGVKEALAQAARGAALFHWTRGRNLLEAVPGPRQARLALAEGYSASVYDPGTPGLKAWLDLARNAAVQKLLVVPFTFSGPWVPGIGPERLGSEVSRKLLEAPGLPEGTTVFPSERLASLVPRAPDGLTPVSQADAFKMAADTGQNLVLLGTVTRAVYQPPQKSDEVLKRQRTVTFVDPSHPNGLDKSYQAEVTYSTWATRAALTLSFSLVEVATGQDLVTSIQDAEISDQVVYAVYTGDKDALTADDLDALAGRRTLADPETLGRRTLVKLADAAAAVVLPILR